MNINPINPIRDTSVLILGLGASGLAMARWCVRQGAARVTVADTRAAPPQLAWLHNHLPHSSIVQFVHSPHFDGSLVQGNHAVFVSPGISPAQMHGVVQAAQSQGVPVAGELGLFAQALQDLRAERGYAPQILAITGTNGKTTVTSLTRHLLAWTGMSVAMAGNIGPTLLDTLTEFLDKSAAAEAPESSEMPQAWVLELSSFQLALDIPAWEPTAATVLNITQDHLDWHTDMADYAHAKSRIFGTTGFQVLNRDDAEVMAMQATNRSGTCFSAGMPQRGGEFGIEEVNGMAWLVRLQATEGTKKVQSESHIQRLMPVEAMRIRGRHNATNALAALALCCAAGCALAPMLYGLREYRGEPHRVQSIGVMDGIEFFDDSKGTNVGATVAALQGLGVDRRLVLILGGDGKGQDFSPLMAPVAQYVRSVVLIGRDADRIRAALVPTRVPMWNAISLEEAVVLAFGEAKAGDAVLLSPACASLDMFQNYAHRAQVFCDAAQALALNRGTSLEGLE